MKRRVLVCVASVLIAIVSVATFCIISTQSLDQSPFYFGVTYCGNSVGDAKQLIDKVKTYTNLFILQSGISAEQ